MELIFRDLSVIENRLERLAKRRCCRRKKNRKGIAGKCHSHLLSERPLRELVFSDTEHKKREVFPFDVKAGVDSFKPG